MKLRQINTVESQSCAFTPSCGVCELRELQDLRPEEMRCEAFWGRFWQTPRFLPERNLNLGRGKERAY